MFRKLKRKLILLNMIMISVVMLASFTFVYLITFRNIQNQNKLKMENVASTTLLYMDICEADTKNSVMLPSDGPVHSFGVIIDEKGNYVLDSSFGTISKDFVLDAVHRVKKENRELGKILISGTQYQYLFSLASTKVNTADLSSKNKFEVEQLYQIAFLDITESQNTLSQLLLTFVLIGTLTLFVIFVISIYFAKRSVAPIEETYTKQKQFIQDASHELKTPLASINANLDVITSNTGETVESQQKWLGYIYYEIERMSKLVNDLLSLAKADNIDMVIQLYPLNLSESLENSLLSMETFIYEKGIQLNQKIEQDVMINGDKDKAEQAIKILLDNAVKYVNESGSIDVLLDCRKNQAVLSVTNTGEGIAKEHLSKIFDRFYRVDASRKHTGSYGLGLPIAKSLVESMDGEISVASVQNEITTFTIKFNRL